MDLLTSFILANIARYTALSLKIEQYANGYMTGINNIGIISNDLSTWSCQHLNYSFLIRSVTNEGYQALPLSGYILDIRGNNSINVIIGLLRKNADTRFVIVSEMDELTIIENEIDHIQLCHVLIVVTNGNDAETRNFNCAKISAVLSFLHIPPAVIAKDDKLMGYEAMMFQTIAKTIGLNLSFVDRHEVEIGQPTPPDGLLGDVWTGQSVAGLGTLYAFYDRFLHLDIVFSCTTVELSWAVPINAGKSQPTWALVFISEFSGIVWTLLLVTYLGLVMWSLILVTEEKYIELPFYILALIIGAPVIRKLPKVVYGFIIIFGFLMTSHYHTIMSSKLTVPPKISQIRSTKDLVESDLRLLGVPSLAAVVKNVASASPNDPFKRMVHQKYEPKAVDVVDILKTIVQKRDVAFLRTGENMYYRSKEVCMDFFKLTNFLSLADCHRIFYCRNFINAGDIQGNTCTSSEFSSMYLVSP